MDQLTRVSRPLARTMGFAAAVPKSRRGLRLPHSRVLPSLPRRGLSPVTPITAGRPGLDDANEDHRPIP